MADLRGQKLKDSYQNVVTRGSGNKLENGNGVEFADLDDKASLSGDFLSLSDDPTFSAGAIKIIKVGDIINLTISEPGVHSSDSLPETEDGFVPEKFRPEFNCINVYSTSSSTVLTIVVTDTGRIRFIYRDWNGDMFNRENTSSGSITYAV